MTKKTKAMNKVLSVFLCVVLLLTCIPVAAMVSAAAAEKIDTRIVDPSTMDDWKQFFVGDVTNTENAGGVWTDKSVFTDASAFTNEVQMIDPDNNFMVAMSAIAANKSITGYSHIPTDTILVLDISRSMGPNTQVGDTNNNAVSELITAANAAIAKLQAVNNYNRVGVVLYSGNYVSSENANNQHSTVLLPLGRYEHTNNRFLVKDSQTFRAGNDNVTAESVKVNSGVTMGGKAVDQTEKEVYGGTYIQGGIHTAMREFLSVEDTAIEGDGFQAGTKRIPITVLMSDGLPTIATNNYTGTNSGIGTSNMGNGSEPEDELVTAIPFVTQLTASYAKARIEEHYERDSLFYTLGFKVDDSPVLDPDNTKDTDVHWSTYNNTADNGTMQLAVGQEWVSEGWFGQGHYETIYTPITKSGYDLTESYVNQYFQADDSLTAAFDAIVDEIILQSLYYPTQVDDGNNDLDGYIEFIDDIGQFMEVKDIKGILLGDILFNGDNIARNFIGGGGELGTIENPSALGDEMIRAVKARLGITDTPEAQKLVDDAYNAGQLAYNPQTGEYSNYIGWYADANGNYMCHGTRNDENPPEGAVFYNESYGYLGEVIDGHKNSDMMYISVQIHTRIATGTSGVIFRIPASLIPVVSYNISLTGNSIENPGEITLDLDNTMDIDTDGDGDYDVQEPIAPIRLVYEVGLKDEINELTVADLVGKDYKYYEDGVYTFYTNRWNPEDINHEHPSVAENTVAFYEPNVENERYYYTENSTVYRQVGEDEYVPYTGAQSPAYAEGPFFRQFAVFEEINDNAENNARIHLHYEQMSSEALGVAVADTEDNKAPAADTTWYVPKGTIHRMFENFHAGKGGFTDSTQTAVNSNFTGTLIYSHYLGVEVVPENIAADADQSNYYADVILGNNGKMTLEAAQGIKITKALDETMADYADETFTFTVTAQNELGTEGEYRLITMDREGNKTTENVTFADGTETVEIKAGETAYIVDLPEGAAYTVEEDVYGKGYMVATVNGEELTEYEVTVEKNVIEGVEFVNTLIPPDMDGNLILRKVVEHPYGVNYEIPQELEFTFEVAIAISEEETISETVTLKPGEAKVYTELPLWSEVTIKEIDVPAGFTSDKTDNTETLIIEEPQNYIVTFTNTYEAQSLTPDITLHGDKTFTGRANDEWLDTDSFTFKLQKRAGDEWVDMTLNGGQDKAEATVTKDNQTFDFSRFINAETYTERGVFAYRVVEVFDENPYKGITYDQGVRWFFVTVDDKDMDGSLEIANITGYGGTVITQDENSNWDVETSFLNTYAPEGSDAVTLIVNKLVEDTTVEDQNDSLITKEGFEFGLYQGETLIQKLPATTLTGETLITLNFGAADIGRNIHYVVKEIVPENPIAGMQYSQQAYNFAVVVEDDTVGGVTAYAVISEDVADAQEATGDEVAVEFTNIYDPDDATTYIAGIKNLEGREIADGEFTFELYEATDNTFEELTLKETTVNNGTEFNFEKLSFQKAGEYYYLVKEQAGDLENVTYDTTVYTVTIKVTDVDGVLEAEVLVNGDAENYVEFTNIFAPKEATAYIAGIKNLEGREIADGEFTFELYEATGNTFEELTLKETTVNNGTEFNFEKLSFQNAGEYYYVVKEQAGNLENVTYDTTVYTVTIKVTDVDGVLEAEVLVNGDAENYVEFTNIYEEPTEPPTTQATEPTTTEPTEPPTTQATEPTTTEPTEPPTTQATEPTTTEPTEPPTTQATEPTTTEPTEPPTTQATEPTTTEPTEPPTTQPTEPPVTEPPVTEPPTEVVIDVPKTGDTSQVGLWLAYMYVLGGFTVGAVVVKKHRDKKKAEE